MTAQPLPRPGDRGLEVIEGRAQTRPRLRPWLLFAVGVIIAFFGLIVSRISLDRSAFVLDDLDEKIAAAESQHWDLRLEVARLQSPDRIAAAAAEMGLVFPESRTVLVAPPVLDEALEPEYRWAQLKALLSAQP